MSARSPWARASIQSQHRAPHTPTDPRQNEGIAAAWAVATLSGYISANVRAVTIFEPFGPKGLMSASDELSPAGLRSAAACRVRRRADLLCPMGERAARPRSAESLDRGVSRYASLTRATTLLRLVLPEGDWRAERLLPKGFSAAGPGGRMSLEVGDFSVHWLEKEL